MKKIEATIKPFKLSEVVEALAQVRVTTVTILEVRGVESVDTSVTTHYDKPTREHNGGKIQIITVVHDVQVDKVVKAILKAARTGKEGDGRIFVSPVDEVYRIRTGEKGEDAL